VYKNFINAVELVTTRPDAKGDIAMDDRRVFDNRGANHGFPIKREILPPTGNPSMTLGFENGWIL
jgi:hypothetical protein